MFNFEKLDVWQKAIASAGQIYRLTVGFPLDERFGLTNHPSNCLLSDSTVGGVPAPREAWAVQVKTCGVRAPRPHLTRPKSNCRWHFEQIYRDAEEISRMLSGLRKSLE